MHCARPGVAAIPRVLATEPEAAVQLLHTVAPCRPAIVPALHCVQMVEPGAEEKVPGKHRLHDGLAGTFPKDPAAHKVQDVGPEDCKGLELEPAGHVAHELMPAVPAK